MTLWQNRLKENGCPVQQWKPIVIASRAGAGWDAAFMSRLLT